jgi:hypothetical protein
MHRRIGWVAKAMRLISILDVERCIDDVFECGLITFNLPEGL